MYVLYCFCVPTLQKAMKILVMSGETWYCVKDSLRADKPLGVACCAAGVLVGWHVAVGSLKISVSRVDCIQCSSSSACENQV